MKTRVAIKRALAKISEYEAQIGINEMIIEDYKDDKIFVAGLKMQIDKWNKEITVLRGKLMDLNKSNEPAHN